MRARPPFQHDGVDAAVMTELCKKQARWTPAYDANLRAHADLLARPVNLINWAIKFPFRQIHLADKKEHAQSARSAAQPSGRLAHADARPTIFHSVPRGATPPCAEDFSLPLPCHGWPGSQRTSEDRSQPNGHGATLRSRTGSLRRPMTGGEGCFPGPRT